MINLSLNNAEALIHFEKVKPLIQTRVTNILRSGIKKDKKSLNLSSSLKNFLSNLLIDDELKRLVIATPNSLNQIALLYYNSSSDFIKPKSHANFILRNIFINHAYDNEDFKKLDFIKSLNLDTCPYCNRNYIYYLSDSKKIKPQIDHFYPKSKYPFFSVSFYNLIPSCQTCNGFGAKEEKDPLEEGLINPYNINNADFKLSYKINSIEVINPLINKNSVSIKFIKQLKAHVDIFKLQEFYDQHSDHVLELVIKSKMKYSSSYRNYLKKYKDFKFSDDEIDRLILGNYSLESEIHKRPLAKLYQDIGRELGLIEK